MMSLQSDILTMSNKEILTKGRVTNALLWKIIERFFSQIVNIVIQIILARIIAPEYFGALAIIIAITNYASIFVQSGISTAIIQKKDLDRLDVSSLLTLSLGAAAILYSVIFFASSWIAFFFNTPNLIWPLRVQSLILFLQSYNSVQTALLARELQFKQLCLRTILAVLISGTIGIGMALAGFNLWALVSFTLTNVLVIVLFMNFYPKLRVSIAFSWQRVKAIYKFAGNILITSAITGLHDLIRSSVIGKKFSKQDLAYYDKAFSYSSYVTLIIIATLQSVLLPIFSKNQNNLETVKKMARLTVKMSAFIMTPILTLVAITATSWVPLLLTERWNPCIEYMTIFCIIRAVGCIVITDKQVWYSIGRSDINLYYEIGIFITNLILLVFTMQLGPFAIAIGAMIIELFGGLSIFIISSKYYNYSLKERFLDLYKPLVSCASMTVSVLLINQLFDNMLIDLFMSFLVGLIVYCACSILIRDTSFKLLIEQTTICINSKFSNK